MSDLSSSSSQQDWEKTKLLHDFFMKVWSIYITWFTWSLGSNALAISWIITSKQPIVQPVLWGIALVMMASLILACLGVYFVQRFLEKIPAQALLFSNATAENNNQYLNIIFGAGLTRFVSYSMIATFVLILVGWGFVIYYGPDMFASAAHPGSG
jgi:hypothetical protein